MLSQALLQLLIASLQESPGCQAEACQQGVTGKLLNLLRLPANDYTLGYLTIQALGLLANKAQPAALAEVTAGGVVSVVMNVLQQQAMAGVLVSEVRDEDDDGGGGGGGGEGGRWPGNGRTARPEAVR